jgi:hypothetical protein
MRDDILYLDQHFNDYFKFAGVPQQHLVPIEDGENLFFG